MITTLIFVEDLDEEGTTCLQLDSSGTVITEPLKRPWSDIIQLQINSRTLVILPTSVASIHDLELPKLSETKALAVIPFALEDKLAQPIDEIHVAFDNDRKGHYRVLACDKAYLDYVIATLEAAGINFDVLTIDWFALFPHESCKIGNKFIVHHAAFQGALSDELMALYKPEPEDVRLVFTHANEAQIWLASRLQHAKIINLCQGTRFHHPKQSNIKRWMMLSAGMSVIWFVSFIFSQSVQIRHLNQQIVDIDTKIAVIYHQFFPESKQVTSPKFRITQALKTQQGSDNAVFWTTLNKLSLAGGKHVFQLEQIRFQNKNLLVTLNTKDFQSLEALENELKKQQVQVKQTQASKKDDKVVSTLELSL